jgi:hypothetical protein
VSVKRRQLVEIEDLERCPAVFRNGMTDYLRFVLNLGNNFAPIVPLLARAVQASKATRIVDLCSGGGGPWEKLLPALRTAISDDSLEVTLTDKFPNPVPLPVAGLAYHFAGVDVFAVPPEMKGVRTLFSAFHHFPPDAAKRILSDAIRSGQPIGIFEATERSLRCLLLIAFAGVFSLFVMPFIRPIRATNLLFTYIVPVIPFLIMWDGIVSCLRTYTVEEMRRMVAEIPEAAAYDWQIGSVTGPGPVPVLHLVGIPKP